MTDPKLQQIENEIDKMSIEDLLFVQLNPQSYISEKFKPEINNCNRLIQEIQSNTEILKQKEMQSNLKKQQELETFGKLKTEIEQTKDRINKLLLEKQQYNVTPSKKEFIQNMEGEMKKKFRTPDMYFKDLISGKINIEEFGTKFKELGTDKNYYYYKVLVDKIKEMK